MASRSCSQGRPRFDLQLSGWAVILTVQPGRLGDRLAVVIVQLHQQPADHLAAGLPGFPQGKHPATCPSRSARHIRTP